MVKVWKAILTVGVVVSMVAMVMPAQAKDEGRGFTITPPIFELTANPGDSRDEIISLYNQGDEDLSITVSVENLVPFGEAGQVQIVDNSTNDEKLPSLKDWIKVSKNEFKLKKGATENVDYTLSLPENASPGGHFASIVFSTGSGEISSGGAGAAAKIGALILLTVSGDINESAQITEFSPVQKIYLKNGNIDFNLKVENKGNVYIRPRGFMVINNVFGRKVAQVEVDGKNILPTATRKIPAQFAGKHLVGPYTVTLALNYGASNKTLNATTGFWVIPWIPTLIIVVVLLIIIIFRKRIGKALKILFGRENR